MASTSPAPSLKDRNNRSLYYLLVLNGVAFWALVHLNAITTGDWPKLANGWLAAFPVAGIALTGLLNSLISADMKARLVFWRWRHPLPGSAAFTRHGPSDQRVNMAVLAAKYGPLPADPKNQNLLWYRLFKTVETDPGIDHAHRHFLFARDFAVLALGMLLIFGIAAAFLIRPWSTVGIYLVLLLFQWGIAMRAANDGGHRIVTSVLAMQGARSA